MILVNLKTEKMKKVIFLLLAILCISTGYAEPTFYHADSFAYKYIDEHSGRWNEWSRWQSSEILISIDIEKEVIEIYTEMEQKYNILKWNGRYKDNKGGEQSEFVVVDQDGDKGIIRIRIQWDDVKQLYVEYDNVMWVYSGLEER